MFLFELLRDYMLRQSSYDISDMAMLRAFTLPVSTTKYGQLQYTYSEKINIFIFSRWLWGC